MQVTDEWGVTETLSSGDKIKDYHAKALEAMKLGKELVTGTGWETKEGWKKEAEGKNAETIFSKSVPKVGKVFVAQAEYDINAESMFEDSYYNIHMVSKWNPTISEYTKLCDLGNQSDITYSKTFDMLGGVVKSRDFVEARCWRKFDNWQAAASQTIKYPQKPSDKSAVRAENYSFFQVSPLGEDKCRVNWMMATDLKGFLPRSLTDRVMHSMMLDYMQLTRKHVQLDLNKQ